MTNKDSQFLEKKYLHTCYRVVMFHPDLLKIPRVYGSAGNDIYLWNLAAGSSELHATLHGHHAAVTDLAVTHNQKHMVR